MADGYSVALEAQSPETNLVAILRRSWRFTVLFVAIFLAVQFLLFLYVSVALGLALYLLLTTSLWMRLYARYFAPHRTSRLFDSSFSAALTLFNLGWRVALLTAFVATLGASRTLS